MYKHIKQTDIEIYRAIKLETKRQNQTIELIASENFVSNAVLEAAGSVLTNKYAEGYPAKRYYGGCNYVDIAEELARERVCELFKCKYANVQPHSGSQANMAVYFALMNTGDTMLSMNLSEGGHLTHGSPVNFSGKLYNVVHYGVDAQTGRINYDDVLSKALSSKPKVIIAGASAYPRGIDFKKFREIADECGAYLVVDMAHIAGLVAAGEHMSPIPYAHVTTSTTHKTLRGPRSGIILTDNEELYLKINKVVFPGMQGGPLMHIIAAKAVAFKEALSDDFKEYQKQIVKNARALAEELMKNGFKLVSGGTDNHLMLMDLRETPVTGKDFENALDEAGITVNKNTVPGETRSPFITSGIRIGTPAVTTRGMKEKEMEFIAQKIKKAYDNIKSKRELKRIKKEVKNFLKDFPLY